MKNLIKNLYLIVTQLGIDPRRLLWSIRGLVPFIRDYLSYRRQLGTSRQGLRISSLMPFLADRYDSSGVASGHYFHQDLWAARKIYQANPARHFDVGSSVSGFVAHLLTFREVQVIDIRPLSSEVDGLSFVQADATALSNFADNSIESISSLHAAEHFGLGRYGDPVDPDGHIKFMHSLQRVLKPGGRLYFGIPCGKEALYFNAHRVLSPHTVLKVFSSLRLVSFSCVKDDGRLYKDVGPVEVAKENYGCGLFEFTKD